MGGFVCRNVAFLGVGWVGCGCFGFVFVIGVCFRIVLFERFVNVFLVIFVSLFMQ